MANQFSPLDDVMKTLKNYDPMELEQKIFTLNFEVKKSKMVR